jgi:ATP/maltotriose-dependent transcriptional regulator MalT
VARRRCRELLRQANPGGEAVILVSLGGLEAMAGRFDEARSLTERASALYEELGQTYLAQGSSGAVRGEIELLAGDPAAAEWAFRRSYESLVALGDSTYAAACAAYLAEAIFLDGRHAEATDWVRIAEEHASPDDAMTQIMLRSVRARLLAAADEPALAEALAREAANLASSTDALATRAKITFDLAEVLYAAGKPAEASAAATEAAELFDQKGSTVGLAQAHRFLAELAAT